MQTTLFTPSYRGDLERALWMRRSIRRFLTKPCRHLIAVPRIDLNAFAQALRGDSDVELVAQEDAVDAIFYPDLVYRFVTRLAPSQAWRLDSRAGSPGWIVQQIVKLNCTRWVDDGAVLFVDSDLVFMRPFIAEDLAVIAGRRVLVRVTPPREESKHRAHIDRSRKMLALPLGLSEHHYMAYPAIWHVEWVKRLQEYLLATHKMGWQRALFEAKLLSEYTLYGLFVEEVLRPNALVIRSAPFHHIVFDAKSFRDLKDDPRVLANVRRDRLTLVVQSNLGIPVADYQEILDVVLH
jgi:hypothetical protein